MLRAFVGVLAVFCCVLLCGVVILRLRPEYVFISSFFVVFRLFLHFHTHCTQFAHKGPRMATASARLTTHGKHARKYTFVVLCFVCFTTNRTTNTTNGKLNETHEKYVLCVFGVFRVLCCSCLEVLLPFVALVLVAFSCFCCFRCVSRIFVFVAVFHVSLCFLLFVDICCCPGSSGEVFLPAPS